MSGKIEGRYAGMEIANRFAARPIAEDQTRIIGVRKALTHIDLVQREITGKNACQVEVRHPAPEPTVVGVLATEGYRRVDALAPKLKSKDTIVQFPRVAGYVTDIVADPDARRVALVDASSGVREVLHQTYPDKEKADSAYQILFNRMMHLNRRAEAETLGANPNERKAKTRLKEIAEFIKLGNSSTAVRALEHNLSRQMSR